MDLLKYLEPLLLVLLGSFFTFWGIIYSVRKQWEHIEDGRKREMKGEKEFNAIKEARLRLQAIKELYLYDTEENCKEEIVSYNKWFFDSQPFLPPDFNNKWAGLRDSFVKLWQLKRDQKRWDKEKFEGLHKHVENLINESFRIISSKLNVIEIVPEIYEKTKSNGTKS